MKTRQQFFEELLMKEERISAWEQQHLIDKYLGEDLRVEYWDMSENLDTHNRRAKT